MNNPFNSLAVAMLVIVIIVACVIIVFATPPGEVITGSPFTVQQKETVQNAVGQMPALCDGGVDFVCDLIRPFKVAGVKVQRFFAGVEYSFNGWGDVLFGWMD